MKILHTSDWHLGHRLLEESQHEEQALFLQWLENYIRESEIDILLISGDIFDTGVPSSQSQKMYYDFLIKLNSTKCKNVIITGGNHDSPGTINAPKQLLDALSIHVIGRATENPEHEVFTLNDNSSNKVIIAAVPFLRDQDIRRAVAGESFEQIGDRYKKALITHYDKVAEYCGSINIDKAPIIAMGHLYAIGAAPSESEQYIYVGNLGDISAEDFPKAFDYIALGHLHRPQKVAKHDNIRYSGSPIALSFSEVNQTKKVIIVEIENNRISNITSIEVPKFRELIRVTGSINDCIKELNNISNKKYPLTPWVEVVLNKYQNSSIGFSDIQKAADNLDLEVLKVTFKNERSTQGIEQLVGNMVEIKELSPIDVFKMKCEEQEFIIEDHPEIVDAFNEALQIARQN